MRFQVRVVVTLATRTQHPHDGAAKRVRTERDDEAIGGREHGCVTRPKNINPLMLAPAAARPTPRVDKLSRRHALHRHDRQVLRRICSDEVVNLARLREKHLQRKRTCHGCGEAEESGEEKEAEEVFDGTIHGLQIATRAELCMMKNMFTERATAMHEIAALAGERMNARWRWRRDGLVATTSVLACA